MKVRGKVISGKGEGKYYMSLEPYQVKFKEVLGYVPYPGTLNVKLDNQINLNLDSMKKIDDFEYKGKKYYGVYLLPINLISKDILVKPCALIMPIKSDHPKNVVEIVSSLKLRKILSLKDGDKVLLII